MDGKSCAGGGGGTTRRTAALGALGLALAGPAAALAQAPGVLNVGAYPTNPPFEVKDERGQFDGLEVDIVREIARRLGMELRIADMGFQALFAATSSRRIDAAISTITITPERLKSQDFSQPYMDTDLALIAGPSTRLTGLKDARGATLGALASSTSDAWIRRNQELLGLAAPKTYDTITNLFLDVQNGRVDGGVNDEAGSRFAFRTQRGMRVLEVIPSGDRIGLMLPKGSPLTPRANEAITAMKQDGTMARLYEKWFGAAPSPGSSTVTVMPLPRAEG